MLNGAEIIKPVLFFDTYASVTVVSPSFVLFFILWHGPQLFCFDLATEVCFFCLHTRGIFWQQVCYLANNTQFATASKRFSRHTRSASEESQHTRGQKYRLKKDAWQTK